MRDDCATSLEKGQEYAMLRKIMIAAAAFAFVGAMAASTAATLASMAFAVAA